MAKVKPKPRQRSEEYEQPVTQSTVQHLGGRKAQMAASLRVYNIGEMDWNVSNFVLADGPGIL